MKRTAVMAVVVLAGCSSAAPTPSPSPTPPVPTTLPTGLPGSAQLGQSVVFSRFNEGVDGGVLYRIDPGDPTEHEIGPVNDAAILSPDGQHFLDYGPTPDGRGSAAVFNVDGSDYRILSIDEGPPDLPGGQWLGSDRIVSEGGSLDAEGFPAGLYSRRASDGGDIRQISDAGTRHDYPLRCSPDGSMMLFFRPHGARETSDSADQDLFVVSREGQPPIQLSPAATTSAFVFSGVSVNWAPDSKTVAVVLAQGSFWGNAERQVYLIDASGEDARAIGPRGDIWDAAWSPDGQWIAFTLASNQPNSLRELYLMTADGGDVHKVVSATDSLFSTHPTWSANSQQLLIARGQSDSNDTTLWVVNADGSGLSVVADTPGGYRGIALLP